MPALPSHRLLPLTAALAVASAFAQTTDPAAPDAAASAAITLPAVRVTAGHETATGPVDGYVAQRSATATKTDTPLAEVPQSISVIAAEQVRDQASQTMQEVLRYSAGVRAEMYGIDNRGDWFTLRGGSEGSVLLDGLRLPLSGYWGVVRNEPYAFERIEVLRGPASVIAGQNGPGGVVNMVSKRPNTNASREIGLQTGNVDHKQVNADLGGALDDDGTLSYRLVALAKDSGTQVNHAFDKRKLVAPSLTWRPRAGTALTLFGEYQHDESGNLNAFFPYQGTITSAPNGPIPMETFISEPDWDTYGGKRKRLGYAFEQRLNDTWSLRHNLRHDRVDGFLLTMYAAWFDGFRDETGAADPNGRYLNRTWYGGEDHFRITNADLLFEGKLRFGDTQHTLLAGVDALRLDSDQKDWSGDATPLDVYNPVYGSFARPVLDPVAPLVSHVRRAGVLLQDQIKFGDHFVLVAGLRRDRARSMVEGSQDAPQEDDATSRNLGAVWLAPGGWSPYASYSESFEPVGGTDAELRPFKPSRGKQLELGVKWQPEHSRLNASAAVYRLKENNRLATDPDNVDFSIQRGEVTVNGFELEATMSLPAWDVLANYTYTNARVTSTTASDAAYLDHQLYGIPRHAASLWALHRFTALGLDGLQAGLGARYVGPAWDGLGLQSVPAVTQFDALLAWDTPAWRVALNVNNLGDKRYVAACLDRGDCWFGARRKTVLSLTHRF